MKVDSGSNAQSNANDSLKPKDGLELSKLYLGFESALRGGTNGSKSNLLYQTDG